jgi:hypothetical protein
MENAAIIYGIPLVLLGCGVLLGLGGRIGRFFLLLAGIAVLAILSEILNPEASFGDGSRLTAQTFAITFLWVPALLAGFVASAFIVWLVAVLGGLKAGK